MPSIIKHDNLSSLLKDCLVSKKNNDEKPLTHTRFGNDDLPGLSGTARAGSYHIPTELGDPGKPFFSLLEKFLFVEKKKLTLTERHLADKSPVIVDLDMQYDKEAFPYDSFGNPKRNPEDGMGHNSEQLKIFCKSLLELYSKFITFDMSNIEIFVMERENPYLDDRGTTHRIKDGVHIIIPMLVTDYKIHFYVRELMMENMPNIFSSLKLILSANGGWKEVYDKSVIETNGWLMYGCSKPKRKPYLVSLIWNDNMNEIDKKYTDGELLQILSIRRDIPILPYKSNLLEEEVMKNSGYKKKNSKKNYLNF